MESHQTKKFQKQTKIKDSDQDLKNRDWVKIFSYNSSDNGVVKYTRYTLQRKINNQYGSKKQLLPHKEQWWP